VRAHAGSGGVSNLWPSTGQRDSRDVERVRDASDIVRIVGECVQLRPKGREYAGLCPFHDDHNPSMYVVPSKQIFNCFVCGAAGDVFSFVMRFHKMEFREALEYLAERAGITLTRSAQRGASDAPTKRALLDACAEASRFYRQILREHEHGQEARETILRRAISPAMVERFELGAAPDRWDGLILRARQRGLDERALLAAGLIKRRESGDGAYDLLRRRLIFPIHNKAGQTIAFGGRKLRDEDEPKYLNSPETPLFNKSATLYALHLAAPAIHRERTAIVCEGYTDVIACHQHGFEHAVATLGTALTREHARELRTRCDRVVLLFDGDDAGRRAADRAVPVFFGEPIDVRIATLASATDAKDPDELLRRPDGAEVFRRVLAGARDLLEYRFDRVRERLRGAGMSALEKGLREEMALLVEMGWEQADPMRRALIERRLSEISGLSIDVVRSVMPAGRSARAGVGARAVEPRASDEAAGELARLQRGTLTASEHLLGCLLADPSLWAALDEAGRALVRPAAYRSAVMVALAEHVSLLGEGGTSPGVNEVLASTEDPDVRAAAVGLMSRVHVESDRDGRRVRAHFEACLTRARQEANASEHAHLAASDDPLAEALRLIELKRRERAALGADRRVLPRPGGG
jgi:DNA primase